MFFYNGIDMINYILYAITLFAYQQKAYLFIDILD